MTALVFRGFSCRAVLQREPFGKGPGRGRRPRGERRIYGVKLRPVGRALIHTGVRTLLSTGQGSGCVVLF